MKVLLANHQLDRLAGSELHTLDLCRGFRRAGHEVCVFTLEPGLITETMREEGFPVYTPRNVLELVEDPPDLIYLHHSTCEVFLGIVFAGRVPIVRGFVSRQGPSATPVNGGFLSGALFISEEVEDAILPTLNEMPHMVARNVVDDDLYAGSEYSSTNRRKAAEGAAKFAVVSNHDGALVSRILEEGKGSGKCEYSRFGGNLGERVPITPESLEPFDAVVTLGRTAVMAATIGKPVYVADIHGSDGWISREDYAELQQKNFSGRRFAVTDRGLIERQLFDPDRWPEGEELHWISERMKKDHSLLYRVRELEGFFEQVITSAPPPSYVPDGYRGVYNFLKRAGRPIGGSGTGSGKRNVAEIQRLKSRVAELERELEEVRSSRVFRLARLAGSVRAVLPGRR